MSTHNIGLRVQIFIKTYVVGVHWNRHELLKPMLWVLIRIASLR